MELQRIEYTSLNGRQKENYNFQKVSGVLAEYGYVTLRLSDDWNGADFIALHIDGSSLKVQLKSRLTFDKKYIGKDLWVCFPRGGEWFLYNHDEFLEVILSATSIGESRSWFQQGGYSTGNPGRNIHLHLDRHCISR